jgi:fibronectin-binding autotransporter adhesin
MKKAHLSRRGNSRSTKAGLMLAAAAASFAFNRYSAAAIGTWIDTSTDSNWSEAANWMGGTVPGSDVVGSTTNGDTAWFNNSSGTNESTVNLDVGNWNVMNVTFDSSAANNFTIGTQTGTNALVLSNGGEVLEDNLVNSSSSEIINAPVVLEGTATFENDASASASGLKFMGNISAGVSGPATLNLQGANGNGQTSGNDQILGNITGNVNVVVNPSSYAGTKGLWEMSATTAVGVTNYTGSTTVDGGVLEVTTAGGISPYTDVTVNNGGQFTNNATGAAIHSLTVENGNVLATSSNTGVVDIANNIGPAIVMNGNLDGVTETPISMGFDLTGTGGIISIDNETYNTHYSFEGNGKTFDLGTTSHVWYQNLGNTSTDIQVNTNVSSDSTGGGIIKSGAGTVKLGGSSTFSNDVDTFTGPIEVQEGNLKVSGLGNTQLPGGNTLLVDGGTFDLNGSGVQSTIDEGDVTVASFTATAGAVSGGSAANYLFAPNYNFNIAPGTTFTMNNSMADYSANTGGVSAAGETSAVNISGGGQVTLGGTGNGTGNPTSLGNGNAYSGGTTINGSTVLANMTFGAVAGSMGVPGSSITGTPLGTGVVTINGGTLNLDPNIATGSGFTINYSIPSTVTYGGGSVLNVKGDITSSLSAGQIQNNLTISLGGLASTAKGTLVIAPAGGTAASNFGVNEIVTVTGGVPTTNGIVNSSIIGQNNDSNASGDFLNYGANGFVLATYSGSTNINTAGSSAVYNAGTGGNTNTLSGSFGVYALNAEAQTIDTDGNTLTVGDNISGHQAGVILNGGSIVDSSTGGTLNFGLDEGTIYTSKAGSNGPPATPEITAIIAGSGGVTFFGPGKVYLTGANTFTGGININQGTVNVANSSNLGSGNAITFGGGTLQFSSTYPSAVSNSIVVNAGNGTIDEQSGALAISSSISGAGNLTIGTATSTGSVTFSNSNSYGGTTIDAGNTLQINTGGSLGTGSVVNNGGLIFNSASTSTVSSAISGSGSLTQSGTGTVALSGSNSYAGATTINSGASIRVSSANALGFGGANLGVNSPVPVATVNASATLDLNGQMLNKPVTLDGGTLTNNISTTAGLSSGVGGYELTSAGVNVGADLLTLTGGGPTATNGGVGASAKLILGFTPGVATQGASVITTLNGGSGYTSAPTVNITDVGGGSGATATCTISGGAVNSVTILTSGSGYFNLPTISFSGGGGSGAGTTTNVDYFEAVGAEAITAGSGYTSAPTVTPFLIDNSSGSSIETLPTVTAVMNNVSVEANSTVNGNVGAIVLNGVNGTAASGTVTLNLTGAATGNAINGIVSDNSPTAHLALSVTGGSTWTLRGANTYTGNTTVTSSTLDASNSSGSATGTGSVTLTGGTLTSDSGAISGNVSADATSVVAPGGIGNIGTLTLGGLSTVSGSTLNLELGSGAGPEIPNGSLLALGSGTISIGSGTSLVFPNGSSTTIGDDYRLIGGTIGGINLSNFSLPTAPVGQAYSLSTSVDSGYIDLVVAAGGPANLTWNDFSTNNLWDNGSSTNWNNGSSNTTFSAGSSVTFNDTNGSASGRYAVTLNTLVSPGSVTVNNTTGNYTISGTGTIGGTGSLTKMGTGTLTLSTPNTYTGGTNVSAGRLLIAQAGTNATIVSGTTLTVGNTLTALPTGALSISGSGIVQLADGVTNQTFVTPNSHSSVPTSNINLTSLSITGTGTLDIGNNRIIVDYTSGNDPIASIAAWIKAGYNDGDTPGAGPSIISSDIATDDTASGYSYGIGYADGADHVVAGLPSGEIEIMFTLLGDANLDGTVNGDDFSQFSSNLGGSPRAWDEGDFNYDGTVNGEDFAPFSHNQGQTDVLAASETGTLTGPLELSNGISLTNVPEPASMGFAAIAGIGLLARRRKSERTVG